MCSPPLSRPARWWRALGPALLLLGAQVLGQTVTQSVTLHPGWNAVWLECEPPDPLPERVFAGVPVAAVWMRTDRLDAATFVQDQNEVPFNQPGWLLWLPADRPDAAVLTSLFAIHAHRPYLIKMDGAASVEWTISGLPVTRRLEWVPDAFTLAGLPVDPEDPPTFLEYFRSSAAHVDPANSRREPMYRLAADGRWTQVADTDRLRRGEACWIHSRGASDFTAPVEAFPEPGTALAFGQGLNRQELKLRNRTGTPRTVSLRFEALPAGVLTRQAWTATGGFHWSPVPVTSEQPLAAGGTDTVVLAVRRALMETPLATVLQVRDGAGTLFRIPVTASRLEVPAGAALAGPAPAGDTAAARPFRGLWVGTASVNFVAEVREDLDEVTSTKSPFPLRLLLHVDGTGQTRLLKEVIQMWEDGTYEQLPDGRLKPDRPGRYVLLTDDTLLGRFRGAGVRDGAEVGRRISSAGFEFDGGAENTLPLEGLFTPTGRLTGRIEQAADAPTNPFKHRYHPDHDNLDADFEPITDPAQFESFAVVREVEFEFAATDPAGGSEPAYGYDLIAGIYHETLRGLHRHPIRVQGSFRLRRLSEVDVLNPQPQP